MSILPHEKWQSILLSRDVAALDDLLAEDVVYLSPVTNRVYIGKALAKTHLSVTVKLFGGPGLRVVRTLVAGRSAVLEFRLSHEGTDVNGVDILDWDEHGRVVKFTVMLRPIRAVTLISERIVAVVSGNRSTPGAPEAP